MSLLTVPANRPDDRCMPSTPIITVWTHHDGSFGGISPSDDREFVSAITRFGHAIVTDSRHDRSWNHHVAGIGIGHDDAKFCESGDSFAAYLENGEAFGGPWWEQDSYLAHYDPSHPRFAAKRAGR